MLGRRDARVHNDVSWSSARAGRGIHHLEDGGGGGGCRGGGGGVRLGRLGLSYVQREFEGDT